MSRIFIGGLPDGACRADLERDFERIGRLRDVWVARNPPGFGFVVFDDPRDAEDAVKEMDGKRVCGTRVHVEMARGPSERGSRQRNEQCYNCGKVGHISRDCRSSGSGGGYTRRRPRSRSRSPERRRRRERSRSISPSRERLRRRSRSNTRENSRERRHSSRDRSRSASRDDRRSRSKEKRSRSRSRSASVNGNE